MSTEFFEGGLPWPSANVRGFFCGPDRDSGYGLRLPADLKSVDEEADRYSEDWGLWVSGSRTFYALRYQPGPMEWLAFRFSAPSIRKAREKFDLLVTEGGDDDAG